MKKAKLMLSAIAVLAVVGAGLAFKARMVNQGYCTANTYLTATCQGSFASGKLGAAAVPFYYTLTTNPPACLNDHDCSSSARFFVLVHE